MFNIIIKFGSILVLLLITSVFAQDFSGIKIYINPGHGGHDPANDRYIPATGFWESEGNLTKGLHLRDLLENAGATVFISRTLNRDQDDLPLSQISAEANANDVDYFHSVHSNAFNAKVNYPLLLFRGYNSAPVYPDAKAMGSIMWYKMNESDNEWTDWPYSWSPNNRGDWDFYGSTSGLGVLRGLAMEGTLSEGSFHDYVPNSFRLMSIDYRKHESIVIFRSFIDFYNLDELEHGVIAGVLRDKSKQVSYSYNYNSGLPNDQYITLNNSLVTLLGENRSYIVDYNNNGFYMFDSVAPGDYQLVFEHGNYLTDTLNTTVTKNKTTILNVNLTESLNKSPEIYASNPESGATNVPTNTDLIFYLSQPMNLSSFQNAIQFDPSVSGQLYAINDYTLRFQLTDALQIATEYTVTVDTSAMNLNGKKLESPYVLNFITSSSHIHPQISSYYPGADIDSMIIDKDIIIRFDAEMRADDTENAFLILPYTSGQFLWNDEKTEMTFTPDTALQRFKEYNVTILTSALNSFGIPLETEFNFSFWTRQHNEILVVKSFPKNNETDISTNLVFTIQFNSNLIIPVYASSIELKDENGERYRLTSTLVNDNDLRFKSRSELKLDTGYILKIKPDITDIYGLNLEDTVIINFHTQHDAFAGIIIEDFEMMVDWQDPTLNETTIGVDTLNTFFVLSSAQKISGFRAGQLAYSFSRDIDGVCRLYNNNMFNTTDNPESHFAIWVYGDFSTNYLEIWFEKGGADQIVQVDTINWSGWKLVKFPLSTLDGAGMAKFHSIVVRQLAGGLKSSVLYFDDVQYDVVSDVEDIQKKRLVIQNYELYQNYPNPFNPSTTIRYQLPKQGRVRLQIYNILGQLVTSLVDQAQDAGDYNITWHAGDLPSGVYFYRITTPEYIKTRKLALIR